MAFKSLSELVVSKQLGTPKDVGFKIDE